MLQPNQTGVWFRCPLCGNRFKNDAEGIEPCCTGPSWRDEHEMTPMVREQ